MSNEYNEEYVEESGWGSEYDDFEENEEIIEESDWAEEEGYSEESDWNGEVPDESDWNEDENSGDFDWDNEVPEESDWNENSDENSNFSDVSDVGVATAEDEEYVPGKIEKDPDAALSKAIDLTRDSFSLSMGVVNIQDIVIPKLVKESRKETYLGLTRSIEELGCLVPIHLLVAEGYAEYVQENGSGEGYEGPKYILLDGIRRIFALMKNGVSRVNSIIYDFKDKEKGSDMVNILSMILNKVQRKSWSEIWYMYRVLESQSLLSPGNIEYLLQLEPGDAMKLKEVMTRRAEFSEPADDLISKKKTLQQAYNALIKAMKEQDLLAKEDISGVSDMEETEGVVESSNSSRQLSDSEVKEILEMENTFEDELTDADFDEMMGNNMPDDRQTVGNRHPLDPALKAATLMRDNYMCQCCGAGEGYPMKYALSFIQSHHKISVANGGTDTEENIVSLCQNCHTLVHVLLKNGMKFGISKKDYDALPEYIRITMVNAMKIARVDWEAGKRLGKNREDFKKDNNSFTAFKMPGTDLAENKKALKTKGVNVN